MTATKHETHPTNYDYDYDDDLHTAWCAVAMDLVDNYAEAYCNHQCDDTEDHLQTLILTRREVKHHLLGQPASMAPTANKCCTQLPQGYTPNDLPSDYTGSVWVEGQLRQFARAVTESDEALLRQALETMEGLFGTPDQWTGAGGGGVAVWRLGGPAPVRETIAALRKRLGEKA